MSRNRGKPADVLLDLLRGAGGRGRSVAHLVEMGTLFGFTPNTVRVTLSRLQARGVIKSPERGEYRLAETADPINEFVERWRLGEQRVRPWEASSWVFAHHEATAEKAGWALDACGFREAASGLWVRPDNLAMSPAALRATLLSIGLTDSVMMAVGQPVGPETAQWSMLWDTGALDADYRNMTDRLNQSSKRLRVLEVEAARIESFRLGGEAIHLLAKDPLLPADFVDVSARKRLWEAMIEYDTLGKQIWAAGRREQENSLPIPGLVNEG